MGTHQELIQAVDDIGLEFSFSSCIDKKWQVTIGHIDGLDTGWQEKERHQNGMYLDGDLVWNQEFLYWPYYVEKPSACPNIGIVEVVNIINLELRIG